MPAPQLWMSNQPGYYINYQDLILASPNPSIDGQRVTHQIRADSRQGTWTPCICILFSPEHYARKHNFNHNLTIATDGSIFKAAYYL